MQQAKKWIHFYLQNILLLPVVHEYVRFPEPGGRHPDVLHVVVLGRVPPHVGVSPLLGDDDHTLAHLCLLLF